MVRARLRSRRVMSLAVAALVAGGVVAFVATGSRGRSEPEDRAQVVVPAGSLAEEARKASALAGFDVVAPVLPVGFELTGMKVDAPEHGPVHEVSMAFKGPFPISITQSSAPVAVTDAETLVSPVVGATLVRARSDFGFTGYTLTTKTRSYELLVETKFGMDEGEAAKILASMVR